MTESTTYALRFPKSIGAILPRLAKEEGITINQFITRAVAEKLSAKAYFEERRKNASPDMKTFKRLISRGKQPPRAGDELPPGYKRPRKKRS